MSTTLLRRPSWLFRRSSSTGSTASPSPSPSPSSSSSSSAASLPPLSPSNAKSAPLAHGAGLSSPSSSSSSSPSNSSIPLLNFSNSSSACGSKSTSTTPPPPGNFNSGNNNSNNLVVMNLKPLRRRSFLSLRRSEEEVDMSDFADISVLLERAPAEIGGGSQRVLVGGVGDAGKSMLFKFVARNAQGGFSLETRIRARRLCIAAFLELGRFLLRHVPTISPHRSERTLVRMHSSSGFDGKAALESIEQLFALPLPPALEIPPCLFGLLNFLIDIPAIRSPEELCEPLSVCVRRLGLTESLKWVDLSMFQEVSDPTIGHLMDYIFRDPTIQEICLQAHLRNKLNGISVPFLLANSRRLLLGTEHLTEEDVIFAPGPMNWSPGETSTSHHNEEENDVCDSLFLNGTQIVDLCRNRKRWPSELFRVRKFVLVVGLGNGYVHIEESLSLFKHLLQSPDLEKSTFVVCFAKVDILKTQLVKPQYAEHVISTVKAAFSDCYNKLRQSTTNLESLRFLDMPVEKEGSINFLKAFQ